ncbi:MAG: sigma-54 dependent transcriptional regulator [Proteobacteria bacterium]|nr:sigma-54 dependent transcriptional regulator [Pseudomonadota bacterium]
MKILIVDDEQIALESVRRILRRRGFRDVEVCDNGEEAIGHIMENDFDLVLLDIVMPGKDGLDVLKTTKPHKPLTEFIIITAVEDVATSVKALRLGAYDYLIKPLDPERLILSLNQAFERKGLRAGLIGTDLTGEPAAIPAAFSLIITRCQRMRELINYTQIMARSGNPVLITGESGTGKELLARAIHRAGPGAESPFIAVNVSSVPASLFESQFFGHVKGAFTGTERDHTGYFEQADGGVLFLDEIGELPPDIQVKFLRVLEEKTITRLGGTSPRKIDFQIVSSTNKNLNKACQEGQFRLDLLYRLNSAHVHLPPLRERMEDIPLLAGYFLKMTCQRQQVDIEGFSPEALAMLCQADYPGNIRELAQVVERAALVAGSGYILPRHLGRQQAIDQSYIRSLCSFRENTEAHLAYVLAHTRGDRKTAAKILEVSIRQLQRRLAEMKENPRWEAFMADL